MEFRSSSLWNQMLSHNILYH
uniref:Uncharacterized protein n=1 Tax=Rhizophora mucronata TaxID=61149 RepID=A0A2P2QL00_RHIMU